MYETDATPAATVKAVPVWLVVQICPAVKVLEHPEPDVRGVLPLDQ
jgi:hypothetical protein